MRTRHLTVGFLAGLLMGVVASVALLSSRTLPQATAQVPSTTHEQPRPATVQPPQVPTQPPVHRYQISAWAQPGATRDTGGFIRPEHGAYVLDTQSGKVWEIK